MFVCVSVCVNMHACMFKYITMYMKYFQVINASAQNHIQASSVSQTHKAVVLLTNVKMVELVNL